MKKILILIPALFLFSCSQITPNAKSSSEEMNIPNKDTSTSVYSQEPAPRIFTRNSQDTKDTEQKKPFSPETNLTLISDPLNIQVVVNKHRKLPDGYIPPDLVEPSVEHLSEKGDPKRLMRDQAARALEDLFIEAEKKEVPLIAVSGYRSFERQKSVFEASVNKNGLDYASKFVAFPGTSEHQTGLSMDVADKKNPYPTLLEQSYGETESGKWLAEHAHRFGFIIRYPKEKEEITEYKYEPWHIRYVGESLAKELFLNDLALEEFIH